MKHLLIILGLLSCVTTQAMTVDIYVSPDGNDAYDGSEKKPLATVARAQELAKSYTPDTDIAIILEDGIYRLDSPIVFTEADSRLYPHKLTIKARNRGKAVISGGKKLKCHWTPSTDITGAFYTSVEPGSEIDQLYVDGIRQHMARFPNISNNPSNNVFDTWQLQPKGTKVAYEREMDPLLPERVARWSNPEGAYLHAMQAYLWGDMHWAVKGKDSDTLIMEGGWQNNRPTQMHPVYRMIENVKEELDAPGEWYYDRHESRLYYIPLIGNEPGNAEVEIVRLAHLIEFDGSMEAAVCGIELEGLEFRYASRTFMNNREPLLRSDWTIYRGGAVLLTGTEDCSIVDCDFNQVGGNAIFVNNYNRRLTISRCYIYESGANGIAFVGNPECVRSPLFQYGPQDYNDMDMVAGAKCEDYPADCIVDDCLITMTGRFEKQTAPIQISMSRGVRIKDCSIYRVPRAGININEGTFGGHVIEGCDIFDTVLETSDHGSFNSWGRDRYWSPDINTFSAEVKKHPALPYLDMFEPNILRHNRWRCDHGWDIDLDDGSSQYIIYDNLLLAGGLKMREGYGRIVTNNIIVNNSLHPHVWPADNGDVFTRNIVFSAYRPASMTRNIPPDGKWGQLIDYNLFGSSTDDMKQFAANGADANSVVGDPMFIDAAGGDFRVREDSPAVKIGFRNFDTRNFGVRSPRLREIAHTPVIPELKTSQTSGVVKQRAIDIGGMTIEQITGEALSAFGVDFNLTGYAVIEISPGKKWAKSGLRKGDLILSIDGRRYVSSTDFAKAMEKLTRGITIEIARDQHISTITAK